RAATSRTLTAASVAVAPHACCGETRIKEQLAQAGECRLTILLVLPWFPSTVVRGLLGCPGADCSLIVHYRLQPPHGNTVMMDLNRFELLEWEVVASTLNGTLDSVVNLKSSTKTTFF